MNDPKDPMDYSKEPGYDPKKKKQYEKENDEIREKLIKERTIKPTFG